MKLIAVDLDGTLLNSKHVVSDFTRETIKKYNNHENKFVIFTGRNIHAATFIAEELDLYNKGGLISSSNGAYVIDLATDEIIANHILDSEIIIEAIKLAKSFDLDFSVYNDGNFLTDAVDSPFSKHFAHKNKTPIKLLSPIEKIREHDFNKVIFYGDEEDITEGIAAIREKFADKTDIIKSTPNVIEMMPYGISKGQSLKEIAAYYNVDMADTIAFGDEMNDETMITAAGTGVAMGNANSYIKEIADYVTLSNDEDGIAHYITENL